jgi:hypothetical protein
VMIDFTPIVLPGSNISFALAGPPRGGDLAAGPN